MTVQYALSEAQSVRLQLCLGIPKLTHYATDIDEFFDVPQIVRPGQTISATSTSKRLGGKGANQAKAAACAGAVVLMDGAVGSGTEGREVIQELCAPVKGVKVPGVEVEAAGSSGRILEDRIRVWDQGSTGKAIIQRAQDGENSISESRLPVYPALSHCHPAEFAHLSSDSHSCWSQLLQNV